MNTPMKEGAVYEGPWRSAGLASGGDGPHDGDMESRVTKLETAFTYVERDIKELRDDVRGLRDDVKSIRTTDFRILFGAIIAVALGLAGLMAKGFHWL